MTEGVFKNAMVKVSESIKKNGDLEYLCDVVDPNGKIADEKALKLLYNDITSDAVREYLDKLELKTKPVTDSVVVWGDIEAYYVVGSDCTSSLGDDVMCYVFEDMYCISTKGKLFKLRVINVSSIALDYDNTLTHSIEPYNRHVKWYANLYDLTKAEDSPLHRYHQFFAD